VDTVELALQEMSLQGTMLAVRGMPIREVIRQAGTLKAAIPKGCIIIAIGM